LRGFDFVVIAGYASKWSIVGVQWSNSFALDAWFSATGFTAANASIDGEECPQRVKCHTKGIGHKI
jgi:hypothetical protein